MQSSSVVHRAIRKITTEGMAETSDILAVEEPLEIRLVYGDRGRRLQKSISVTMRTPGNDAELAAGFLFTEGILSSAQEIIALRHEPETEGNILCVELQEGLGVDIDKLDRHFYTSSSCGVCGKSSINAIRASFIRPVPGNELPRMHPELLYSLPAILRRQQLVFDHTGGLHASALFDQQGALLLLKEDVGRHNALDKLIGAALTGNIDRKTAHRKVVQEKTAHGQTPQERTAQPPPGLPLNRHILLLSGRASFELIQKAAMAGIKAVAAVGAPSSLAVEMAEEQGITLIGFLRDKRFNIYSGMDKITTDHSCFT